MVDDSFDYSTFISVGLLAGIAQAQRSVPQFDDGALAYSQYYWHIFVDQAIGNAFTEYLLPVAFKQDPRYFTKGHGGFLNRTGYALSRLVVTRTDSGGSQINASEIIGKRGRRQHRGPLLPLPGPHLDEDRSALGRSVATRRDLQCDQRILA